MQSEFFKQFRAWEDRPFIVTANGEMSYRDTLEIVSGTADQLRHFSVGACDRVVILSENSVEMILLLLACWSRGFVAAPLSVRNPQSLLVEQAALLNPKIIIVSERLADKLEVIDAPVAALEKIVLPGSPPEQRFQYCEDATILFTSGSSGRPKAAVHSFLNHYYNALGSNLNIPVSEGDRWLLSLPLYHVGGLAVIFRTVLGGGAVAIPQGGASISQSIRILRPTHLSLVAAQLRQLMEEPGNLLPQLSHVLLGGSAVPDKLIKQAAEKGIRLHTTYGSTEMASQVTTTSTEDPPETLLTSGRLLKYREIRIAQDGELLVKGQTLFRGYWNGKNVEPAVDEKGWFHTGDIGFLDDEGHLHVTGRKDNMFISGGENIQPEEIEKELLDLPGISGAVVVPIPDERFGHRPVAFVLCPRHAFSETTLQRQLESRLPKFKIPDHIAMAPPELMGKGLKPDRQALSELAKKKFGMNGENKMD